MKQLIVLLSLLIPTMLTAQNTITWEGGTPGHETNWNEPRNWDANRVPNENDKVIILLRNNGHFAQPVIDREVHVAWVEIHAGAELTITSSGQLILDGTDITKWTTDLLNEVIIDTLQANNKVL